MSLAKSLAINAIIVINGQVINKFIGNLLIIAWLSNDANVEIGHRCGESCLDVKKTTPISMTSRL